MPYESEQHVLRLETKIKRLREQLTNTAKRGDLEELITIIHRPGFTSIAESMFANAIVDALLAHTETIDALKSALVKGSRAIVDQEPEVTG